MQTTINTQEIFDNVIQKTNGNPILAQTYFASLFGSIESGIQNGLTAEQVQHAILMLKD